MTRRLPLSLVLCTTLVLPALAGPAHAAPAFRVTDLPLGGDRSALSVLDINERGQIAGLTESPSAPGRYRVVRWDPTPSGYTVTPLSDYQEQYPVKINDRGDVMGRAGDDIVIWDRAGTRVATVAPVGTFSAFPPVFNNRRQVLYSHGSGDLSGLPTTAVLWSPEGTSELDRPDGTTSMFAIKLNERGVALGTILAGRTPPHRTGFRWNGTAMTRIPAPGGQAVAFMVDINDRNQAVGVGPTEGRVFVEQDGRARDIGDLGGGWSRTDFFLPAINARGQITGLSRTASGEIHPFLWTAGRMTDLGTLGGPTTDLSDTAITDLNDRGQVIGLSRTSAGERHPFLWTAGRMQDLHIAGSRNTEVVEINGLGQAVGSITTETGTRPVVWTTTTP
ncbi:hypothetical protein [Thermomonospora umbrina]|uniref:Putative HAF family extracellular repeat protein n=1 Tax=Thermomonospora umbrina TaxID=111806 RepID=A0A3D9SPY6_9ACTN|nr:hypothetical protein [Thermomonospora umbrina]REE97677.1 putative HAF family extracellular repeat protein [Thermomonospora umbrina]